MSEDAPEEQIFLEAVVSEPLVEEKTAGITGDWTPAEAEACYLRAIDEIGGIITDFAGNFESTAISAPNVLVVRLKARYNKDWCERADVKRKLEQTLSRLAGRSIRIDFVVHEEASPQRPPRRASSRDQVQKMREIERHPLVQEAVELFEAEIVHVDGPREG